jgi:hypothetical protein
MTLRRHSALSPGFSQPAWLGGEKQLCFQGLVELRGKRLANPQAEPEKVSEVVNELLIYEQRRPSL